MRYPLYRLHISFRFANKHGRHRHFLVLICQFLKMSFSETAYSNKLEIGRKHIYKVLYSDCSFSFDPLKNMAATDNSCFWLANVYQYFFRSLLAQMNRNLVGNIYGKSSIHPGSQWHRIIHLTFFVTWFST